MSSKATKLPIIDFSDQELKPGTPSWNSLKVQVQEALEEYGCFEASFNKIPLQLRKSFLDSIQELFDLPLQTKTKSISNKAFYGYLGQHPQFPLLESMVINDPNIPEMVEGFVQTLWPQGNPNLSKIIQAYSQQLSELDQMVRIMVLESLGIEKYMDEHLNSTTYLVRVLKYKTPKIDEPKVGMPPHKDKNIVSILHASEVPGLQVETKDGQWIRVKPSPDSFIVLIGESFHGWTNGRLYAPYHRVIMDGNGSRYSIGLFSIPKSGYELQVPKELVDGEHPLLFKPFEYFEFRAFSLTEEGGNIKRDLKAYCGV
ncbi:hypothetical protein ACH5RR_031435 [Cinchona calisaya]|uniref:Fe2OG dioxygenase domain-containing protein n=1 Tax=Cinchona calisaya TaxID=153742 RepID=A0ABD2YF87_9GENT